MPRHLWRPAASAPVLLALLLAAGGPAAGPRCADARVGIGAHVLTGADFDSFLQRHDKVLVDFYDPGDAQWPDSKSELQAAVRLSREYGSRVPIAQVDISAEAGLRKKYVPNGPFPQLMWFRNGHATQYHRSLRKAKLIVEFVVALDRDPIQTFDSEEQVRRDVNRAVFSQIHKSSPMYRVLEVVASKHMDTIEFAFKESGLDDIRWVEEGKEHAKYAGEASVPALERWVREQIIMSEPIPESQDPEGPVVVVGHTFEELVLRKDKDVFILIYAPWCGYSRKFFPTWESFAKRVARVPHLVVAKMDGDRNGSPYPEDFGWRAYPTVFYFRAGERMPVAFHGNRTVARLLEFARQHSTHPIEVQMSVSADGGKESGLIEEAEWEL